MKITFYTKWDGQELICACYIKNPMCSHYKECEEIELEFDKYANIHECMKHRKYKKQGGVIKQI